MTTDTFPLISSLGDVAVVATFGERIDPDVNSRVVAFAEHLEASPPPGMIEYIPAFTTVTVLYDPLVATLHEFTAALKAAAPKVGPASAKTKREPVDIPVCYGGEFGPDLDFVAGHNDLAPNEVVEIHSSETYTVCMIGFAPGFPYLGGMSPTIATPRLDVPRTAVPAGSVGIAGEQTGVYPMESPGGWRLIGRTPRKLFRPDSSAPSLLQAGDHVRFIPIDRSDFDAFGEDAAP